MIDYFLWTLMLIGWVYLITEAAVFALVRVIISELGSYVEALIYCPSCMGFWVGAALAATGWWPHNSGLWAIGESAIAAMAVANTWSKLTGGSAAWAIERGYDDSTQTSEERKDE